MANFTESTHGQTISFSGPALFMRCEACLKITMVNALVTHADFIGDTRTVTVPSTIICSPCVRKEREDK